MKTLFLITIASFLTIAGLAGCGSSNNNSTAASVYSYVNGLCYNTSTNTPVATTYCTGTTYNSSMFSYNGTTCTNLQTGVAVNVAYCTSNPFTYSTGGCYDSIAATYVSTAYCSTVTATGTGVYTYVNGICVNTTTGIQMPTTYCSTAGSAVSGYATQPCYGSYYTYNGYIGQLVACYGANCRGDVLYSVATKTPVVCQ